MSDDLTGTKWIDTLAHAGGLGAFTVTRRCPGGPTCPGFSVEYKGWHTNGGHHVHDANLQNPGIPRFVRADPPTYSDANTWLAATAEALYLNRRESKANKLRVGQAFANTLPSTFRRKVLDEHKGLWESDDWADVYTAVDFLLTPAPKPLPWVVRPDALWQYTKSNRPTFATSESLGITDHDPGDWQRVLVVRADTHVAIPRELIERLRDAFSISEFVTIVTAKAILDAADAS